MRSRLWLSVLLCSGLWLSRAAAQEPAPSPADFTSPTLGYWVTIADRITIFQVVTVDPVKQTITWSKLTDLKGTEPEMTIVQQLDQHVSAAQRRNILGSAIPGQSAVAFSKRGDGCVMCLGNRWCDCVPASVTRLRFPPDLGFDELNLRTCYVGPVSKLIEHLTAILAVEEVVITIALPTRPGLFDDEPTPIVRDAVRGKKGRVCRVRASLKLVDEKSLAACRGYFVGWGVGGAEAVPGLIAALSSKEARERAEAAEDLGQIGAVARDAVPALRITLRDEDGIVCVFAAEALARIDPDNKDARAALIAALKDKREGVGTAAATALFAVASEGRRAIEPLTLALEKADDPSAPASSLLFWVGWQPRPKLRCVARR